MNIINYYCLFLHWWGLFASIAVSAIIAMTFYLIRRSLCVYVDESIKRSFSKEADESRAKRKEDLEYIRGEIVRITDRATNFHQWEYDVLPKAWRKLRVAHGAVAESLSTFSRSEDLTRMSPEELRNFLELKKVDKSHLDSILNSKDQSAAYANYSMFQIFDNSNKCIRKFINYMILNDVFIDECLKHKMMSVGEALKGIANERQGMFRSQDELRDFRSAQAGLADIAPRIVEIETDVRLRMRVIQNPPSTNAAQPLD